MPEKQQAFPAAWGSPAQGGEYVEGMELRDWFAGQALPTLLKPMITPNQESEFSISDLFNLIAEMSYQMADEMIAARNKE